MREQCLRIDVNPTLVDIGCGVDNAISHHRRERYPDRAFPFKMPKEVDNNVSHRSGFAGCGVGIRNRSSTSWPDCDKFTGAAFIPLPPMSIPNPMCEVTGTNVIDQALALVLRSTGSASASARSANDSTRPAAPGVSPSTRLPMTCRVMFAIE